MKTRYLTKSRFKLAMECPTKLFYTGKKDYANQKLEDTFLASLAEGGFQVEELAKAYYPDGYDIETLDYDQALKETNALLEQENCVIFEAAIKYENFFIRVDILVKEGSNIKLIEVKSSSTDEDTPEAFLNKKQELLPRWQPYVHDVTFQYYVAEKALANYNITPYLMLIDKNAKAPTNQLNQKFKIVEADDGRKHATIADNLSEADLSERLLVNIPVKALCERLIEEDSYSLQGEQISFAHLVHRFADDYQADRIIKADISRSCKDCEFFADYTEIKNGFKSGYHACFTENLQWKDGDFEEDTIFNLRDFRKTDEFIAANKIKFSDLSPEDVGTNPGPTSLKTEPLSRAERRWLQVYKAHNNDSSFYINKEKLQAEMEKWTYPLHFIDFETAQPAIPFNQGEQPYSTIAFQYSHHMVYEDGTIEHKSEYLNTTIGVNPNIDFVRHLKKSLENDEGTIFRYSHHENTILNKIHDQLDSSSIEDKEELQRFIRDITSKSSRNPEKGKRNMVDLCKLVEDYFYDPYMKGSVSIKVVLPAILNGSTYLQKKYSKPIYGAKDGIKSLNFIDKVWIEIKDGHVTDPYQLLAQSSTQNNQADVINDGASAMTAYEKLQFTDIPIDEKKHIEEEMLKYCELDTLAMVLIYEAWLDIINNN